MEDFQDLKKMASIYEYRCAKKIKVSGCVSTKIESNDTIPAKIKINSVKKDTAWQEICSMAMPMVWQENGRYFPKGPIYSVCPDGIIRIQEIPEFLNR